jgi:hypothetical protein
VTKTVALAPDMGSMVYDGVEYSAKKGSCTRCHLVKENSTCKVEVEGHGPTFCNPSGRVHAAVLPGSFIAWVCVSQEQLSLF